MLVYRRLFSVSSLVLLASALPAAEPNEDGSDCLSSWHAYDSSSLSWEAESTTATITTEGLYPQLDLDVPYTTLCDGRRRALVTRDTTPYTTYDPPITVTERREYNEPSPTCTVPETACTAIVSSYSSALSDYLTNDAPSPTNLPHCTTYVPCSLSPDYCFIYGSNPKVYYWPITTVSGDFCAYNGSTIFAEPTNPPNPDTVVTDGYTFTSPTNYISFHNLRANIHGRRRTTTGCGTTTFDNIIVPLTTDMTTKDLNGERRTFNFEDLNSIPADAFKAQRRCRNNPCTDIEDFYTPELALPTEVLDLQPEEWKAAGCKGTDVGTSWYHPTLVALVTPTPTAAAKLL